MSESKWQESKLAAACEDLQNSINNAILISTEADPEYARRLNDLRLELFRIENDLVRRRNLRLNYMIGMTDTKTLEDCGY